MTVPPVRFFMVMSNSLHSLPKCMGQVDGLSKGLRGKRAHRLICRVRTPRGAPAVSFHFCRKSLVAAVSCIRLLDLRKDATEVVAFRRLQRRELLVGRQVLQPKLLADRQHVPVILESRHRTSQRATEAH